jgi:AraC-like DNA-binding protein
VRNQAASSALLISWGVRAMYIGPGFQLQAHRNSVAILALALKTPLRIAINPNDPSQGFQTCNSVLIEPNQLHLIETDLDDFAFIYLDALSHDLSKLRARFAQLREGVRFEFDQQHQVIALLNQMPRHCSAWLGIEPDLARLLGFDCRQKDLRIASIVDSLIAAPDDQRKAQSWAEQIGLSSSRFQHLFRAEVGLSFRRFRLWARMRMAIKHTLGGASLTDSAHFAGLSSSAHLSAAFRDMFGITPSQLVRVAPLYIDSSQGQPMVQTNRLFSTPIAPS